MLEETYIHICTYIVYIYIYWRGLSEGLHLETIRHGGEWKTWGKAGVVARPVSFPVPGGRI